MMKRFSRALGGVLGLVALGALAAVVILVSSSLGKRQAPGLPSPTADSGAIGPVAAGASSVVSQSPLPSPTPQRLPPTATSSPGTVLRSPLPSRTASPLPPTPELPPPTPDPGGWLAEKLRIVSDEPFEIEAFSIEQANAIEAAAWSPDGQRIAVERIYVWEEVSPKRLIAVRDLWVLGLDGSGTLVSQNALAPDWSPDGSYLAYLYRAEPERYELDVATWPALNASSLRTGIGLGRPQWISGSRIVFSTSDGDILSIARSGQQLDPVFEKRALATRPMESAVFAASPDGRWLVVRPEGQAHKLILSSLVDGSEWIVPSRPESWYLFIAGSMAWSPDSKRFAHIATWGGVEMIHVVDVEMRREWDIVPDPAVGDVPHFLSWSPDGNVLVLTMRNSPTRKANLYVVNVDDTGLRNLSRDTDAYARRPLWSPDGKSIFYSEHTDADQTIRPRLLSVSPR